MKIRIVLYMAALVALIPACSSDTTPTSSVPPDSTPPQIVMVTPENIYHFSVTFDEAVSKSTAQNPDNYTLVALGYSAMVAGVPGDTMRVTPVLAPDTRTVEITVYPAMVGLTMGITVFGVSDVTGNRMVTPVSHQFASGTYTDDTPPQVFWRSPEPNTRAPIGGAVVIEFSEPVDENSFRAGASWQSGNSGEVNYHLDIDGVRFTLTPTHLLDYDDEQTITLAGIHDQSQNNMPVTSWSFLTTNVVDNTPPSVVSTSPKNHALNVSTASDISITFSEPVNQFRFVVNVHPSLPADWIWSEDGKTFTLKPWADLSADQQYAITLYPSGVLDLAGNTLSDVSSTVFSTGAALEDGRMSGTVWGDPFTAAASPAGAIVVAGWNTPYALAKAGANGSYQLSYLEDGPYAIFAFKDTNGDGNPRGDGDAVGAYGADPRNGLYDWQTLQLANGAHLDNLDFPLFDPSYVTGTVNYSGGYNPNYQQVHVGLFDTAGFDPAASLPVAVASVDSPYDGKWSFNNIDDRFPDRAYYVAAYIDVTENQKYDPAMDPYGIYGGAASPTVVTIDRGSDVLGATIEIADPFSRISGAAAQAWPSPSPNRNFQHFCEVAHAAGCRAVEFSP